MLVDKHHLAIEHFKNSLNGLKKFDDSWEVFFVYVNLTDFYLKTRDLDMASAFADSSMNLAGKYQHDNMYSQAYVNLGEIALEQRNYNKAIPLFLESYKYFNKTMDYRGMIVSCINLSSTFRQLNHPESALIYARRAIVLAEKSNGKELMRMANNNLAMQYYAANMADSAFLCAIKAMAYKDSINNAEASVGTSYYEVKLGLEQKESQLHMMQIESHKQRQLVFGLTIFLLVVLIALGIIVWLMRSNEKMLKSLVLKNIDVTREREKYRMELMESQSPHSSGVVCPLLDGEKSTQLYNMAVSWIEQYRRYADKDLTLDLVARELGTNRDYLSRAINEKYGRFTDFLNSYRIHEAKIVLSNPEHPCFYHKMEYVADYVGFTSYSAFVDAFRKETQMTPSLFRKNLPVKVDLIC
jgi:AraC-like DNA-binding protein